MEAGTPSATARAVAQVRAAMDRPITADGDGSVEARLVDRFPPRRRTGMADYLERRTRWFDAVTLRSLEAGIDQVVIVAAGYDCRALRFRTSGVRFYELDHPDTQRDKRTILSDLGVDTSDVTFVATDFTTDDIAGALVAGGHAADRPTVFLAEGLLVYLDDATIRVLLRALRERAAGSSRLAVSISRGQDATFRVTVDRVGEPVRSGYQPDEAAALLTDCGWTGDTSRGLVLATPTDLPQPG
jgi:methyltransferase (TIGR00027 family)